MLRLPDLYKVVEIELLDTSEDEVFSAIKSQFIEFYDQFIQTVEGLVKEEKVLV